MFFADIVRKSVALRKQQKIKRGDLIDLVLDALEANENEQQDKEDDQVKHFVHFVCWIINYFVKMPSVRKRCGDRLR